MLRWGRAAAVLAALGATAGTLLDGIHTHFGATAYTHPVFWRAAWWVPLLFAGAYSIGLLGPLLERRRAPPSWPSVLAAWGCFVVGYWTTVLPLTWPAIAALLVVLFALAWTVTGRSRVQLGIAVAAALGGPAVESLLVSRGVFVHLETLAFGVPGWLPFLYLVASVPMCTLARRLV